MGWLFLRATKERTKTMDFKLNEMEQEILDMLHDFCVKEVAPIAAELDEKEEFTQNAREKLAEMGMLGTYIPEEYGGAGLSYLTYIVCCEELAKHCASTSIMFSVHGSLCSWPIFEFGTEEQKQKYLVPLAQGEKLGAMGLTEPGAGTDANGVRTTAVLKGDKWILNGTKIFITNGYYADTYVVFARTNPDLSVGHKGRPPSSWRRASRASASAPRRRRWASALPPPMSWSSTTAKSPLRTCWARKAKASRSP